MTPSLSNNPYLTNIPPYPYPCSTTNQTPLPYHTIPHPPSTSLFTPLSYPCPVPVYIPVLPLSLSPSLITSLSIHIPTPLPTPLTPSDPFQYTCPHPPLSIYLSIYLPTSLSTPLSIPTSTPCPHLDLYPCPHTCLYPYPIHSPVLIPCLHPYPPYYIQYPSLITIPIYHMTPISISVSVPPHSTYYIISTDPTPHISVYMRTHISLYIPPNILLLLILHPSNTVTPCSHSLTSLPSSHTSHHSSPFHSPLIITHTYPDERCCSYHVTHYELTSLLLAPPPTYIPPSTLHPITVSIPCTYFPSMLYIPLHPTCPPPRDYNLHPYIDNTGSVFPALTGTPPPLSVHNFRIPPIPIPILIPMPMLRPCAPQTWQISPSDQI